MTKRSATVIQALKQALSDLKQGNIKLDQLISLAKEQLEVLRKVDSIAQQHDINAVRNRRAAYMRAYRAAHIKTEKFVKNGGEPTGSSD